MKKDQQKFAVRVLVAVVLVVGGVASLLGYPIDSSILFEWNESAGKDRSATASCGAGGEAEVHLVELALAEKGNGDSAQQISEDDSLEILITLKDARVSEGLLSVSFTSISEVGIHSEEIRTSPLANVGEPFALRISGAALNLPWIEDQDYAGRLAVSGALTNESGVYPLAPIDLFFRATDSGWLVYSKTYRDEFEERGAISNKAINRMRNDDTATFAFVEVVGVEPVYDDFREDVR